MLVQSALTRNTLLTLSYRNCPEELDQQYPQVLALLSCSMLGMEEGLRCLRAIQQEKVRLRVWGDERLLAHYTVNQLIALTGVDDFLWGQKSLADCHSYAYFFLPVLSCSLVSKVVRFDDRDPFSQFILEALFNRRKIGALPVGADPYHPLWREKGYDRSAPFLKQQMKSQLQQLRGFGVELLETDQVLGWLQRSAERSRKAKVLSQEEITAAHLAQQHLLVIEPNTIITPLARDLAKHYRIELMES